MCQVRVGKSLARQIAGTDSKVIWFFLHKARALSFFAFRHLNKGEAC